jgi:pimeloyl-ACP methyl ester carboxylesterase
VLPCRAMDTTRAVRLAPPITATAADLPGAVAAALRDPGSGEEGETHAGSLRWAHRTWGEPGAPPLLLLHGVTSSSQTWWRVGPALAAAGRRVVAPDMPGHGRTGGWTGRHRFHETARDIADLVAALGLPVDRLAVVGHSWGAVTTAALAAIGLRPERLVLIDPPVLGREVIAAMLDDPVERPYDDLAEAVAAIGGAHLDWATQDVEAKAAALVELEPEAARAVLVDNGDWDGGLADLEAAVAAGVPVHVVRGESSAGGYLDDIGAGAFAAVIGPDRIMTIAGGPHSPHRTHPEATVLALLRALGATGDS